MNTRNNQMTTILGALSVGAVMMYLMDPSRGRRRRAMLGDQIIKTSHKAQRSGEKTIRDARNRILGILHSLRSGLQRASTSDAVLAARVRSNLGSLVRRARAIHVDVDQGRVILEGSVGADEADDVIDRLVRMPGVISVVSHLKAYDAEADMPGFRHRYHAARWLPANSPTSRFLTGTTGGILTLYSLLRGRAPYRSGVIGAGVALIGLSFLATTLPGRNLVRLAAETTPKLTASR